MTGGDNWRRVASDAGGGGAVAALAGSADLVFAATSIGIFRSWDGGLSWQAPGPGSRPPLAEGVAVSPDFPCDRTAYTCAVDGLYRSTDGGDSWQPILVGSRILSVACAGGSVVLAGTQADGVLRSPDGGRTWESASAGLLDLEVICLAARGELVFAGTQGGLHRSRNSGRAWRAVGPGTAIQCLALSVDGAPLLVGTERDGLFRSTDLGSSWQAVDLDDSRSVSALAMAGDHVVAATPLNIAASHDAGVTWRTTPAPGDVLALAIHRGGVLAGLHQDGLVRSNDDGATWSPPAHGVNARVVSAAAFGQDGTFYVADIDAGLRTSPDAGRNWRRCRVEFEPPSALAISADNVLFASSSAGVYVSRPGSDTWSLRVPSARFDGAEITALAAAVDGALFVATRTEAEASVWRLAGDVLERRLIVPAEHPPRLAASRQGSVVAAAGNRLFNLTGPLSEYTFSEGVITALAVREHTVFVGTAEGVYLGAQSFIEWNEGLPSGCRIVALGATDDAVYAISFGGEVWRR